MDKSSQDLMEKIRRLGSSAKDFAGQGTDAVKDWYGGINPEAKKALIRGLTGAAVAGGGVAAMRALTPKDREKSTRELILSPTLLAALLGGGVAAGLPAGMKMLGGGIKFEAEKPRSGASAAIDSVVDPMVRNPGTTIGTALGVSKVPAAARALKRLHTTGVLKKPVSGKFGLLTIPAGFTLGAVIDRYLKGKM